MSHAGVGSSGALQRGRCCLMGTGRAPSKGYVRGPIAVGAACEASYMPRALHLQGAGSRVP